MAFDDENPRLENAYTQGWTTARSARDFVGACPYRPDTPRLRAAWLRGFTVGRTEPWGGEAQPAE